MKIESPLPQEAYDKNANIYKVLANSKRLEILNPLKGGGLVILAVVFLLGISVGRNYRAPATETVSQNQPQASASLMIDYGDGRVKTYHNLSGATAFDVLKNASDANGVELKYKDYGGDLGIFIESISGVGKDPSQKKWWQYWVDNKYSQVGVSAYKVEPGDTIQFKFIEGQE